MSGSVLHSRSVVSRLQEASRKGRAGWQAKPYTSAWWSVRSSRHVPLRTSHTRMAASQEPAGAGSVG